MNDLHAFVRHLAGLVTAHDPDSLHTPLAVGEIQARMMPYRACRRALGLDTAEEYELLLLRLVAEESGLGRTDPPEAAERCRVEVAAVLPDLAFLQELSEVTVLLQPGRLQRTAAAGEPSRRPVEPTPPTRSVEPHALDPEGPTRNDRAAAASPVPVQEPSVVPQQARDDRPPSPTVPSPPASGSAMPDSTATGSPASPAAPLACPRCDRTLPQGRPVRFCPDCGQNVLARLCPSCRSDMELTWRHCVLCGHPAADASSFA